MRSDLFPTLLVLAALPLATRTSAQTLTTRRVASGLTRPLWAGAPAGDDRLFVVEKGGRIVVYENGVSAGDFLAIGGKVSKGTEQGLLGMAFHPAFASNGTFFLDYTNTSGNTVVSRWKVSSTDRNRADPASEQVVLTQNQPASNHNAGAIQFGPDGYLYVTFGDGGFGQDCNAQDLGTWLGKILRIDVDSGAPYAVPPGNPFVGTAGALPEIWAYGLRNPWRSTIDRVTGDLYIGDVGENTIEEISFAGFGQGGLNFGWRVLEGTNCRGSGPCGTLPPCASSVYTPPLVTVPHAGTGARAIIGGYVYRGCAIPSLQGTYFYSDNSNAQIHTFRYDPATGIVSNQQDRTAELHPPGTQSIDAVASFGEDGAGELLIVDNSGAGSGEVYKVLPANPTAAASAQRNGSGTNHVCYVTRSQPILGNLWRATVDVSGHAGATVAGVAWYDAPLSGVFLKGSELLVDLGGNLLFSDFQTVSDATVPLDAALPCDPSLQGAVAYTQAVILGGGQLELCNANDLTFGLY